MAHSVSRQEAQDQHECEILGRGLESEESERAWEGCQKNPGHEAFISIQDFKDNCLPHVQEKKHCDVFNAMIDLTVRLRITWTSRHRPDEDKLCSLRGSDETRCGTGFIRFVCSSVCDELCPCVQCDGKIRNSFLKFTVQTAQHVVYNTEEARAAMVDLFYDDDSCRWDGIMKTVIGLEVVKSKPDRDFSYMLCVTHDKALSERIQSAWRCWWYNREKPLDLSCLDILSSCDFGRSPTIIFSHTHGQPKMLTVGRVKDANDRYVKYNTATCRGSSGATVFWFRPHPKLCGFCLWFPPVHSGMASEMCTPPRDQLNVGYLWL